jgi:hypothetical protein
LHLTSIIQQLKNALDEQMSAKNPRPAFGFVDPVFDQASCRDIVVLVANLVCRAQRAGQLLLVVFAKLTR